MRQPLAMAAWIGAALLAGAMPLVAGPPEDLAEALEADDRGDLATAVSRLRALAESGYARGQAAFGTLYFNGRGVPQDFVEAYKWFGLAAAALEPGGERDAAVANRDLTAQRLSPAQMAQAQDLIGAWKPK